MDPKLFMTVFASVFLAELGDKTQLATLLYATDAADRKMTVFLAAAGALVVTSAIGVLAGGVVSRYVAPEVLTKVAGAGFIVIGLWTLLKS